MPPLASFQVRFSAFSLGEVAWRLVGIATFDTGGGVGEGVGVGLKLVLGPAVGMAGVAFEPAPKNWLL